MPRNEASPTRIGVVQRLVPQSVRGDAVLGLVVVLLTLVGAWRVSPWLDEVATAHVVSYSSRDMASMWQGIPTLPSGSDMVHAAYYEVVHWWVDLVGITPFTLRLPSVIAAGVGTMAMAGVGRRLVGRRGQLAYAAAYGLLPRTLLMAIEARPYAMSSMFAALALLLVVVYRRRPSWLRWVGLVLAIAAAMLVHLYAALPMAGLVAAAWFFTRGRRRWMLAAAGIVSAALVAPFGVATSRQLGQIGWLASEKYSLIETALVQSWAASRTPPVPEISDRVPDAIAAAMAVVAAILLIAVVVESRGRHLRRLAFALVPVATGVGILWIASLVWTNVLQGRYLTPVAPFFAMALAELAIHAQRRWIRGLVILLMVGSLTLFGFQQRTYAKASTTDYNLMSRVMRQSARAGDGFLIDPIQDWVFSYRGAVSVDPGAFAALIDLAQPTKPPLDFAWAHDPPELNLAAQEWLPPRIWLASWNTKPATYGPQLAELGYHSVYAQSGVPDGHTVTLWEK
ncbi:glycosyltransferase family 39 protein [Propionibacterium freudenreichii]|uniref:glycosyltransferase family 39 protein n=1 Tax=Propionibacterium freudenreichii TaxID=1744 RepID=UPI000544498C|nr:glycosyltransferase family 39 protein [Propionibacterium freudenreichii]MCT2996909.1 hypothetical protein [Propionibacterium freudenreichii]MCT3001973.1 hypothetical protein [Propionibacterium freudenreichii]CEH00089.1 Hypothetical transmembrane protein [Propionibacterium freudenreichii]